MQNWLSQNKTKTNVYMTIYGELLFHRFIVTYLLMNMIHQKLKKAANIYTVDNAGSCHFPPPPPPSPPQMPATPSTQSSLNGGIFETVLVIAGNMPHSPLEWVSLQYFTLLSYSCEPKVIRHALLPRQWSVVFRGMEGDGLGDFIRNFLVCKCQWCHFVRSYM